MKHEVEHYLQVGFDDYLAKPIKRRHFIRTIASYLGQEASFSDANAPVTFEDKAFLQMKHSYIENLHSEVKQLGVHTEQKNFNQIARISHIIKGTAGNFGFDRATELAAVVETSAKQQRLEPDLVEQLTSYTTELYMSRESLD